MPSKEVLIDTNNANHGQTA